ncbi:MAG: ATP-dependent Clp protease proteolytic subunit [bacterium]|nr:ATP-dependent Clp protease proteolytic subunit [bacterium]
MTETETKKVNLRSVWITDLVNDSKTDEIIQKLVELDMYDSEKPIYIFINTSGGTASNAVRIRSLLLNNIKSPLITVGVLSVISAGCALIPCGHVRVALVGTNFLYHEGRYFNRDISNFGINDLRLEIKGLKEHNQRFLKLLTYKRPSHSSPCKITSIKLMELIKNSPNGNFDITANEALKLGLIDKVIVHPGQLKDIEAKLLEKFSKKLI